MNSLELIKIDKVRFWRAFRMFEEEFAEDILDEKEHDSHVLFDKHIGLIFDEDLSQIEENEYRFFIKDGLKFFLAKIKYGI